MSLSVHLILRLVLGDSVPDYPMGSHSMPLRFAYPEFLVLAMAMWAGFAQAESNAPVLAHYGEHPQQQILSCSPSGDRTEAGILLFHGGGWTSGAPNALIEACKLFARDGIAAFSVGYRLANGQDRNRWPAQLDDAAAALAWVREHAANFGISPSKLCVYGELAGAHIALALAQRDRSVICAIDAFGPVDLTKFGKPWEGGFRLLFGDDADHNTSRREASPQYQTGKLPLTLIIHGKFDDVVPLDQSLALLDKIRRDQGLAALYLYDGGHAWQNISTVEASLIHGQVVSFVRLAGELAIYQRKREVRIHVQGGRLTFWRRSVSGCSPKEIDKLSLVKFDVAESVSAKVGVRCAVRFRREFDIQRSQFSTSSVRIQLEVSSRLIFFSCSPVIFHKNVYFREVVVLKILQLLRFFLYWVCPGQISASIFHLNRGPP